ncbi:hypothetical protein EV643_1382 [Kribbella sp. VKM Ac-2527]|uniref:Uncharacterized protein n=1 Tax=Kribbella caucasensis TaxID=2512215 RepID=A0A4R6J4S2_9ACTN|nr:hypothetical protein EV643_1382 [Kribbella sp. VKM Ac-2527]
MVPRTRVTYVDRQGHPINRSTWLALSARREYVVIEWDCVGGGGQQVQIMTIWLGLRLPTPMPPIFETLVQRAGSSRPRRWTWANLVEAQAGHVQIVGELTTRRGEFVGRRR